MTVIVHNKARIVQGLMRLGTSEVNTPEVADIEPGLFSRLAAKVPGQQLQFEGSELSQTGRGIATGIGGGPGGESYTNISNKLGLTPSSLLVQLEIEDLAGDADTITEYPNGLHILWREVATLEADATLAQKKCDCAYHTAHNKCINLILLTFVPKTGYAKRYAGSYNDETKSNISRSYGLGRFRTCAWNPHIP